MASTMPITPFRSSYYENVKNHEEKSVLGKDDFLRLFVEQLKQQNPLQPVDSKEFISQMSQFTSMEQTMNMVTSLQNVEQQMEKLTTMVNFLQPMTLSTLSQQIGNTVYWYGEEPSAEGTKPVPSLQTGVVQSVLQREHQFYYLLTDGQEVEVSKVVQASKS